VPLEAAAIVLVAGLAVLVFQRSPELQQGAFVAEHPAPARAPVPAPPAAETEAPQSSREASTAASGEPAASAESNRRDRAEPPVDVPQGSQRDAPATATPRLDATAPRHATEPPAAPPTSAAAPAEQPLKTEGRAKSAGDVTAEKDVMAGKKDAEGGRAGGVARQVAPAAPQALQEAGEIQRLAAALDVQARLAVAEPASAERAVRDLIARAGGHVVSRVEDEGAVVLTLSLSGDRWDETRRGLQTLGTLRLGGPSPDAARALRISLRLER
jgi:hypothetical protein